MTVFPLSLRLDFPGPLLERERATLRARLRYHVDPKNRETRAKFNKMAMRRRWEEERMFREFRRAEIFEAYLEDLKGLKDPPSESKCPNCGHPGLVEALTGSFVHRHPVDERFCQKGENSVTLFGWTCGCGARERLSRGTRGEAVKAADAHVRGVMRDYRLTLEQASMRHVPVVVVVPR